MKKVVDLVFCFKGSRQYVHGTDIFTKLTEQCDSELAGIDLVFHGIVGSNMTFFAEKPSHCEIKVIFRCSCGNKKIRLFGVDNGKEIDCRYDFTEEMIIKNSKINLDRKSIYMIQPAKFSFIEHIVAMNKALVETLYNNVEGKWYFTRLQLEKNIQMNEVLSLEIQLLSNFQLKLTKSLLVVNNEGVGYIFFSHTQNKEM